MRGQRWRRVTVPALAVLLVAGFVPFSVAWFALGPEPSGHAVGTVGFSLAQLAVDLSGTWVLALLGAAAVLLAHGPRGLALGLGALFGRGERDLAGGARALGTAAATVVTAGVALSLAFVVRLAAAVERVGPPVLLRSGFLLPVGALLLGRLVLGAVAEAAWIRAGRPERVGGLRRLDAVLLVLVLVALLLLAATQLRYPRIEAPR